MKKITFTAILATALLLANPFETKAQELTAIENKTEQINSSKNIDKEALKKSLLLRLEELKSIDKSELTSAEKKEIRKEIKAIKKKANNNGIYLSTTAIVVIILIIILL